MAQIVITKEKLNNNSCRICLESQYPSFVKITNEILATITSCFGVQVINGPLILCTECALYIVKYNDFKEKVQKSNEIWNSYLEEYDKKTEIYQLKEENEIKSEIESDVENSDTLLCERELDNTFTEDTQNNSQDTKVFPKQISKENVKTTCLTQDAPISQVRKTYSKCKVFKRSNRKSSILKCENCDKTYIRADYLIRHREVCNVVKEPETRETNVKYKCGLCGVSLDSKEKTNEHVSEHFANNDLECKICGFQGSDFAEMEGHRYKHHDRSQKHPKTCHICNKTCIATMSLIFHFRSVHLKMKGSSCKHCNKFIRTYRGWKRHELLHTTHNFICDVCGTKFLQRHSIVTHMKRHYGVKEHVCDVCGKAFTRLSYLKVHINTVHTSQSPVKCSHCNKDYKSQFHLDQHMKEVNQSKPFQCELCLKFYATEARLKKHSFWHSGARPFACDICSATYKARSTLKLHMRETHSSYRPFKCTICEKAFVTHQRLRRHTSMHTGVRKFKCPYCDRSFHSNAQLNAHCSTQHKTVIGQPNL